jgi:hypothetical protein
MILYAVFLCVSGACSQVTGYYSSSYTLAECNQQLQQNIATQQENMLVCLPISVQIIQ